MLYIGCHYYVWYYNYGLCINFSHVRTNSSAITIFLGWTKTKPVRTKLECHISYLLLYKILYRKVVARVVGLTVCLFVDCLLLDYSITKKFFMDLHHIW